MEYRIQKFLSVKL
ncbi:hypothetical protein KSF78_0000178 [Schistosoma japonicum]|nr:hypothetical protein KSF78_0000178 [Schistosoma japonicum]